MKTSVVIPTRNNSATIGQCLNSLMPYYERGYITDIVVVDALSSDNTLEIVENFPVKLLVYNSREAVFTYYARDMGWRSTDGEFVLFIDNDAYLGDNFFPDIYELFSDERVGIIGAQERAVVTNRTTRTIGEWWVYHAEKLKGLLGSSPSSWSWLQKLYHRIAWGNEMYVTTSGPCYIVRRCCLEAVNGFECPEGSADVLLSRRIIEKGWAATWWLEAPLYHHPAASLKHLWKQRVFFGRLDAVTHSESTRAARKVMLVITRLCTPIVGLRLALRFKNPLHLLLFPLAHYAWIIGYLGFTFKATERRDME
ncbi:MAG TPA: glycosyltransferase [Dehalococcoidia bacterium]|nr:glycosyltransferase [Dehalococcoidia bacterium]